jgi:hypothetical protein
MPERDSTPASGDAPSPSSSAAIAGVRISDGRHVFVRGMPADAPLGALVRFAYDGQTLQGSVSIPPSLLVWCDPSVPCGRFLSLDPPPSPAAVAPAPPPRVLLLAAESAPSASTLGDMLALAHEERHRLDDQGTYQPRSKDEDRRG